MIFEQEEKPLSKRQQKRALKRLQFAKFKEEHNAKRKERKKARKPEDGTHPKASLPIRNEAPSGRVIIDCSFEPLMTEKEMQSLCAQISQMLRHEQTRRLPFVVEMQMFGSKFSQIMSGLNPDYQAWKNMSFQRQSRA